MHCPLNLTAEDLQSLSASLALKQLSCTHKHELTLLRNGHHLEGPRRLSEIPELLPGDKLILFMRHQPQCCACAEAPPCPGRHVAVLRLAANASSWDLRVVGASHASSLTSAVVTRLDKEITKANSSPGPCTHPITPPLGAAEQELEQVQRAIAAAEERLEALDREVCAKEQALGRLGTPGGGEVEAAIEMLAAQVENLESELHSDSRSALLCSVCFSKPFVWVFPCGHAKCDDCGTRLLSERRECPECRAPLEDPRRLFWAGVG